MPLVVAGFLVYAMAGPWLPAPGPTGLRPGTHRGPHVHDREGIFGSHRRHSTFIILFTIYGAVLEYSGAGKFFIDFSFAAMGRKPTAAGRTITLASFSWRPSAAGWPPP